MFHVQAVLLSNVLEAEDDWLKIQNLVEILICSKHNNLTFH